MASVTLDGAEYDDAVSRIKKEKTYNPDTNIEWSLLLKHIIKNVFEIVENNFSKPLNTVIHHPLTKTKETIAEKTRRVCEYLESEFPHSPPFTILRLVELTLPAEISKTFLPSAPEKYLASLETLVCVQSSVSEFPAVKVAKGSPNNNSVVGTSYRGKVQTIEMELIPWVTDEQLKHIEEEEQRASDVSLGNEQYDKQELGNKLPKTEEIQKNNADSEAEQLNVKRQKRDELSVEKHDSEMTSNANSQSNNIISKSNDDKKDQKTDPSSKVQAEAEDSDTDIANVLDLTDRFVEDVDMAHELND